MHREPIAQYVSIQRGRLFEAKGTPRTDKADAWHCFEADPSKCAQRQASGAEALEVDARDVGFFLQEAGRLRAAAATFRPSFSRGFEECTEELAKCIDDIYAAVGLPPRSAKLAITPPRVSSSLSLVRNRDEVEAVARDVAAGNWTPGPPHPAARRGQALPAASAYLVMGKAAATAAAAMEEDVRPEGRGIDQQGAAARPSWWEKRATRDHIPTMAMGTNGGPAQSAWAYEPGVVFE